MVVASAYGVRVVLLQMRMLCAAVDCLDSDSNLDFLEEYFELLPERLNVHIDIGHVAFEMQILDGDLVKDPAVFENQLPVRIFQTFVFQVVPRGMLIAIPLSMEGEMVSK